MENAKADVHSKAWYDGCDASFDGILQPNLTGMTEEEIQDFNAGYLYMTLHAIMYYCPD
ncbi:MAG: hypothetical protein IJN50_04925 [Clostridia bacterium]|nr:hypothetical protein [Clostridia bacterium]